VTDVAEADLETTITDLMSGQYSDPVRVVAYNTAEHWSEDASEDVAREIMRRLDLCAVSISPTRSCRHRSGRSSTVISVLTVN